MGWVSPHLRKAIIEIDRVQQSDEPLDNGDGTDWQDVFDQVGWQIAVERPNDAVTEPMARRMFDDVDPERLPARFRWSFALPGRTPFLREPRLESQETSGSR